MAAAHAAHEALHPLLVTLDFNAVTVIGLDDPEFTDDLFHSGNLLVYLQFMVEQEQHVDRLLPPAPALPESVLIDLTLRMLGWQDRCCSCPGDRRRLGCTKPGEDAREPV